MAEISEMKKPEFNKLQSLIFPIHGYELKKFLPMSMLLFCILFVYSVLKNLKDVFIQTYASCGATPMISVLKIWFVIPAAILAVIFYTFLVNKIGAKKAFYVIMLVFAAFFIVFAFFFFPCANILHMNATNIRKWQASAPNFMYYVIPCLGNWSYSLFYIFSELWGAVAVSSLFWQFANSVTRDNEVKRFFGLYTLIAEIGVMFAASLLRGISYVSGPQFDKNVKILIYFCVLFIFATIGIYYAINNFILKNPHLYDIGAANSKAPDKKIGVFEGLKILVTQPYMFLIVCLIFGYGISINFVEVVFKEQLRLAYPNPNEYLLMFSNVSMISAVATIVFSLIGAYILRRFRWRTSALITPIMMLILGGIFFLLSIFVKNGMEMFLGFKTQMAIIWVGMSVTALAKGAKFSVFDATRSMVYIPLDEDTRTKGQAAVEIVGSRAGKATSSGLGYALTNVVAKGSMFLSHIYIISGVFAVLAVGWIASVFGLSKMYEAKVNGKNETELK